jgi:hypothetical protein
MYIKESLADLKSQLQLSQSTKTKPRNALFFVLMLDAFYCLYVICAFYFAQLLTTY